MRLAEDTPVLTGEAVVPKALTVPAVPVNAHPNRFSIDFELPVKT